jgi:hypothetical protein
LLRRPAGCGNFRRPLRAKDGAPQARGVIALVERASRASPVLPLLSLPIIGWKIDASALSPCRLALTASRCLCLSCVRCFRPTPPDRRY